MQRELARDLTADHVRARVRLLMAREAHRTVARRVWDTQLTLDQFSVDVDLLAGLAAAVLDVMDRRESPVDHEVRPPALAA